ncbi:hypothetical protein SCLCIDRAFT_25395 [Scleroderma citrinum Foug A]|uniref:Uncharacterized protein n=1 Tax=Scleroderma citrinum Foug A TaxID=1036808 RepID=A0A0C3E099_9AGAM|nr:hypothetical protein SCLCIDRAFT_25395 [Scleroderma citrinum Foug A]
MACLLSVVGQYRSIIKWAGMAPAVGQSVEWSGSCESSTYTLTQVATYLTTNGVTYHDADDAWVWGNTHLHKLRQQYLMDENPEVAPICDLVEANIQRMSGEAVSHSCEHVLKLAASRGVEPHLIPPLASNGECKENSDWQDQMVEACELYALPAAPPAASSLTSMDVDSPKAGTTSLEDGEVANLFEGPAPM